MVGSRCPRQEVETEGRWQRPAFRPRRGLSLAGCVKLPRGPSSGTLGPGRHGSALGEGPARPPQWPQTPLMGAWFPRDRKDLALGTGGSQKSNKGDASERQQGLATTCPEDYLWGRGATSASVPRGGGWGNRQQAALEACEWPSEAGQPLPRRSATKRVTWPCSSPGPGHPADWHETLMPELSLLLPHQSCSQATLDARYANGNTASHPSPGPRPAKGQRADDRAKDREGPHAQLREPVDVQVTGQALGVGPSIAERALQWPSVQGHVGGPARGCRVCGFLHCTQAEGTAERGPQQEPQHAREVAPCRAASYRHSERGAQG